MSEAVKEAKREGYASTCVDTPPNRSSTVIEAIRLATLVVIPARPGIFDLAAVADLIALARELRKPFAVVINGAPAKRSDVEAAVVAEARQELGGLPNVPLWSGQITHRADYWLAFGSGEGVKEFNTDTAAATEIEQQWSAVDRSVKAINGAYKNARAMHGSLPDTGEAATFRLFPRG